MEPWMPMLAVAAEPFDSPEHLFEIKWDGVRALAAVEPGGWRLWGRQGVDYTPRYPELTVLQQLPAGTILDGELVHFTVGRADFSRLLSRHQLVAPGKIRRAAALQPVSYVVFDLLHCRGQSLLTKPLEERQQRLQALLRSAALKELIFSQGTVGAGRHYFDEVVQQGHDGVMAKHLKSPYRPGKRSSDWRKIKPRQEIVCVIVGYRRTRGRLSCLLLAAQRAGHLQYVGSVSTGLTRQLRRELKPRLVHLSCPQPVLPTTEVAHWIEPELYCLTRCFGFTPDGRLRFPSIERLLQAPSTSAERPRSETTAGSDLSA
jgi:DNA ligase D-like protein (predicted ligase)